MAQTITTQNQMRNNGMYDAITEIKESYQFGNEAITFREDMEYIRVELICAIDSILQEALRIANEYNARVTIHGKENGNVQIYWRF